MARKNSKKTAKSKPATSEISVKKDGVVLRGPVVEDVRPPIRRIAKTADSVLRLIDNVVGLPADFVSTQLERFRRRYEEQLEQIPLENRQVPPLRVGCAVLRHVAYAAEEPEIQDLFARLLATASDSTKESKVHPGFASVINDLKPEEAKLLVLLRRIARPLQADFDGSFFMRGAILDGEKLPNVESGLSNLLRLGLLEWVIRDKRPSTMSLKKIARTPSYRSARTPEEFVRLMSEALGDLQNVKTSVIAAFQEQGMHRSLRVSVFGQQFLEACMPPDNSGTDNESEAEPG